MASHDDTMHTRNSYKQLKKRNLCTLVWWEYVTIRLEYTICTFCCQTFPQNFNHHTYFHMKPTRYTFEAPDTIRTWPSSILDRISEVVLYLAGRLTSTVPFNLAVSGAPSPFVLFSGLPAMSVECLVSVFERPSCLPLWVDASPDFLDAAASDKVSRTDDKSRVITYLVFRCV